MKSLTVLAASAVLLGSMTMTSQPARAQEIGQTQVERWKNGREAALMLLFDDSLPTHLTNAIPALRRHGMVGTFYVNPSAPWYQPHRQAWEQEIPATGMKYGDHTMTHSGGDSLAELDAEIGQCAEYIRRINPASPTSPLLSYAKPGGVKAERWPISDEQHRELLRKHRVVQRPSAAGRAAGRDLNTAEEMFAIVEGALTAGRADCIMFHGVGGDWIAPELDEYLGFIERLAAVSDRIWIGDVISVHKYEVERDSARVELLQAEPDLIRLELTSDADPALYDQALTLTTRVPAEWTAVRIRQGASEAVVPARQGQVRYDAVPGRGEIILRPQ